MSESNAESAGIKEIFLKKFASSLGSLGTGLVLAVLLMLYYHSESRRWDEQIKLDNQRWEERTKADESRWQQLFKQYQQSTTEALETIEACCHDRLRRLEDIETIRRGRSGTR